MKVLILGAEGNLGTQLVKVFSPDYEITAWDFQNLDITDHVATSKKITELHPEIIINAVAYNNVDKCENDDDFLFAEKINSFAVKNLAEITRSLNSIFVHYSTDYVFNGNEEKQTFIENDEPNPISRYGETKLDGEKAVTEKIATGLKAYLIRTSKLFGPKGTSENTKPSFFDMMLTLAQTKPELKIVDEEKSCFTYTVDLAEQTKNLIEKQQPFGIYHIVNPQAVTWFEAANELFKIKLITVKTIPVPSDEFPRPAKRSKFSILENTKLPPLRDYREALREYLETTP